MAILHRATLEPSKNELVAGWIGSRRWYTGSATTPTLDQVGAYRFDDPAGTVGLEVLLLRDRSADEPVLYQVPLTYRAEPLAGAEDALVGTLQHSVLGRRHVYDGCHDPVFAAALLRTIVQGGHEAPLEVAADESHDTTVRAPETTVHGSGSPVQTLPSIRSSRVLRGEQSNTSIIYDLEATEAQPSSVIVKLFRVIHPGDNPDVVVQEALSRAGSRQIPTAVGHLSGSWPDPSATEGPARGHLALAQEFVPGVQDAWRQALDSVAAGEPFPARSLGEAIAQLHHDLAAALGDAPADSDTVAALLQRIDARLHTAAELEPSLEEHRARIDTLLAEAGDHPWPALQRIHGDLHLGQVLSVPARGWLTLDFEGEPLRPLSQRSTPDCVLRDVAGMLRSFDYAAGSAQGTDDEAPRSWAQRARADFLEGYVGRSGLDLTQHGLLLSLFELDKAAYELVYDVRHRPDWASIPRAAVTRLLHEIQAAPAGPTRSEELDGQSADALLHGRHGDPHAILGAHPSGGRVVIRTLRPLATTVSVLLADGTRYPLSHEYHGIWSGTLDTDTVPDYRVVTTYDDGIEHVVDDPYRFLPTLGDIDLHLIGEGRHERLWTVLGAHVRSYPGVMGRVHGTSFSVWAPHAHGVRVVGDFNHWDGTRHPMRRLGGVGVWELFVPGVGEDTKYKFQILCSDDVWRDRADPMARLAETAPATASVVTDTSYAWQDDAWMTRRAQADPHTRPMSVYEVHLGSWRPGTSYRQLADELVGYVEDLGFTHVELMPVMEHPYPPSWGYHVTGYYAPNSRLGSPDDFRYLVDTLHQHGIGVLLDWVPGHFATDEWALARFDGSACYEHPDPRRGWHPEWGSYIFDFGRPEVRNFLVANAVYWLEEFHADGLRVDGVASMLYLDYSREEGQWLPNQHGGRENLEAVQLLQETNATAYRRCPGTVMIAEESTSWPGVTRPTDGGGLGFGFKWNMGWMHDSLDYVANPPIYRQYHHQKLTFALVYAWSEQFVLPISHDEVVHGKGSLLRKMPGDRWQQLANVRAFLASMWSHPGKQLIFMGTEFAQESEWSDGRGLDWWVMEQPAHQGVHALVRDLNRLYAEHPALWTLDHSPDGFRWIDADNAAGNLFSYIRYADSASRDEGTDLLVAVVNYSGTPHDPVRLGLPRAGRWREVLNTDALGYGGSGTGNLGAVTATDTPANGLPCSAQITVPALSVIWLVPDPLDEPEEGAHESEQSRTTGRTR